ncbi:hypothetical protein [Staphylococcus aureus]
MPTTFGGEPINKFYFNELLVKYNMSMIRQ